MATDIALVTHSMHTTETGPALNAPSKRRILLVDDAEGVAQVMARLLGLQGHLVSLAHDGQSAIATALHTQPHVVLMDLRLPDMHGCDVARELRQHSELAGTLLVAVTGLSDGDTRAEAAAAGFDEFVVKPAAIEVLEQLLLHPKLAVCTE